MFVEKQELTGQFRDKVKIIKQTCRSRLTGAGWGGCCVSLVHVDKVQDFIEKIKKEFYSKNADRSSRLPDAIFASVPSAGAGILDKNHKKLF